MTNRFPSRFAWYLAAIAAAGMLLYFTAPVLSPFLFSAILAYICLPLVDRLGRRAPRWLAVTVVIGLLMLGMLLLALIVAPLVERQVAALLQNLPEYLDWIRQRLLPWLAANFGIEVQLDLEFLRKGLADGFGGESEFLKHMLPGLTSGGMALIGFLASALLVPVVLFYFLRDWHEFVGRLESLIPRRYHQWSKGFFGEIDRVLGEFLHGQIAVMLIMSAYFVVALWLAGLEYALPIGILSGLLVFVPYLGALVGLLLGTLAGLTQFESILGLAAIWAVFGIGQLLEGFLVTPWLVGDRIGLHPVAVIFALLVFGSLFGFFGVLLALPVSAILLVGLRELGKRYLQSELYRS